MKKNIKKILIEIFVVAIALAVFTYEVGIILPKIIPIILSIFVFFTSLEIMIKYYKQLYIPKMKYKSIKIIGIILLVSLMFMTIYIYFNKIEVIRIIYICCISLLLIYLLTMSIIDIKKIIKLKDKIFKVTMNLYLCLMSFVIIIVNLILYVWR